MKEIITNSFEKTQELAQKFIGDILSLPQKTGKAIILALEGDLGSGKTIFAQGLAKGVGIKDFITSPTFVLIKSYRITPPQPSPYIKPSSSRRTVIASQLRRGGRMKGLKNFYHIDCYRIEKHWQMQELGFEEIINNSENLVVIEWPEKIAEILPKDVIKIKFEFIDENRRKIVFLS